VVSVPYMRREDWCRRPEVTVAKPESWPKMKSEHSSEDVRSGPEDRARETAQPQEIIGQVNNPVLKAVRRLCWRTLDRMQGFFVGVRLSIDDRSFGPEPETPVDLQLEQDRKRLVRALPTVDETTGDRHTDLKDA
jgi:hypothetical protein